MKTICCCLTLALASACAKNTDTYAAPNTSKPTTSMPSTTPPPAHHTANPGGMNPAGMNPSGTSLPDTSMSDGQTAHKNTVPGNTAPGTKPVPTNPNAPVATDTSNDAADVQLTARVRKVLVDDAALSTASKNVTIVVNGGNVTLRGQVPSDTEKTRIDTLATGVAGVTHVDNQIEIKP